MSRRLLAAAPVAAILSMVSVSASAEDAPKPASAPAASAPASAEQKPSIKKASCENLKFHVEWSGSGVAIVDVNGGGSPVLAARQDPQPSQTSTDFPLTKEWEGRKVEVRIW